MAQTISERSSSVVTRRSGVLLWIDVTRRSKTPSPEVCGSSTRPAGWAGRRQTKLRAAGAQVVALGDQDSALQGALSLLGDDESLRVFEGKRPYRLTLDKQPSAADTQFR